MNFIKESEMGGYVIKYKKLNQRSYSSPKKDNNKKEPTKI